MTHGGRPLATKYQADPLVMAKFGLVVAIAWICLAISGCRQDVLEREAASVEAELAWVEKASAKMMAEQDILDGNLRFFVVCGYSCWPPAIGVINAGRCFPEASQTRIEGTSDVILSERHGQLVEASRQFSAAYNGMIASAMRAQGLTKCSANTDWDGALNSLSEYISSLSSGGGPRGSVAYSFESSEYRFDFLILLQPEIESTFSRHRLCELVSKNGVLESSAIDIVRSWDENSSEKLVCKAGEIQ